MSTTDFNLAAARAAHARLSGLYEGLRVQVVRAWLIENRGHHKAAEIDDFLTIYNQDGFAGALDRAEALVDRHTRSIE